MLVPHLNISKHLFITIVFIVLTSCSAIKKDEVSHLIEATDSKTFKIVSIDEAGNEIKDRLILESLQQKISKLSRYPSFYSAIDDITQNVSGFEAIIIDNTNIKIQYLNGKLAASGSHHLTKASASFKIDIKTDNFGLYKIITVHQPKSLHIARAKERFGEIRTLDTPDKLQKDVEHIFKNIDLVMERLMFVSGEIIVRNSEDEVFDNFEHLLGLYSKNAFQEKGMLFGIFELKSNSRKEIIPLRIRVFPNTKGANVKYEFDVKYSIKSNGTTTYNEKEIKYLITTIKNVSTTTDLDAPLEHFKVNNKNLIAIIDDPVMVTNFNKPNPLNIHKTSITYQPKKNSQSEKTTENKSKSVKKPTQYKSKKITKSPKTKQLGTNIESKQTSSSTSKSNNIKNVEYIEKMLSSLKEKRPSK